MKENDLQDLYKDKPVVNGVDEKVHLAADSAHYISEYLNTITIELVREGVLDPYVITSQFEEEIIRRLQEVAADGKITLDVVQAEIDEMGTPDQVVLDYIEENEPVRRPLLVAPVSQGIPKTQIDTTPAQLTRRSANVREGIPKTLVYGGFVTLVIFNVIGIIATADGIYGPSSRINDAFVWYIMVFVLSTGFVIGEILSGLKEVTVIEPSHYNILRWLYFNSLLALGIMNLIANIEMVLRSRTATAFRDASILLWITLSIVFVAIVVRDFAPAMAPVQPKWKSLVRFLTPSYLIMGLAVVSFGAGYFILTRTSRNVDNWNYLEVQYAHMFMLVGGLIALISTFFDSRGKYPVSPRKLLFTLFFALAYYARVINVTLYYQSRLIVDTSAVNAIFNGLIGIIVFFLAMYIYFIFLIYKEPIRKAKKSLEEAKETYSTQ